MLKSLQSYFVRTLREDPADAEVNSHKLMVRAGYIRRVAPGIYTWLPLGLRALRKVEGIVREEMDRMGAQEVLFPALLPAEPYKATDRWSEYGPTLFKLQDRKQADYLLAPTHEEMFTLLVKDMYSSYKDLPVTLYQIQTKYRDEARPRAGVIRGREFVMKDAYSFDIDQDGLNRSYDQERATYQRIFKRLGLDVVIVSAMSGAMGGSRSEEFLFPSPVGEDTFVRSPGGYAANAEAVVTPVPEPISFDQAPQPVVLSTPNSTTIATLVDFANRTRPREDRPWQASDTLKNVVVALTHPEGQREIVVIGVPGDRDVDMKRLEAALAPASVEMATAEDLAQHPELVAGYIGPAVIGPNAPGRTVDADGHPTGSLRYLLDPRIVDGTSWITGANQPDHHVFGLVKGRDFTADGTVEAAAVHEGDPAPDGSGPLHLERGIEVGHIFALGRKYAKALDLDVLDQNGKARTVTMGSYGIGVSRVLAALAESNCDDRGLAWPAAIAPFDVHVVIAGKGSDVEDTAQRLSAQWDRRGLDVLIDDRKKVSAGVKFADAELLGMPIVVVVGRSLKDGVVEVRTRHTGEATQVQLDEVGEYVLSLHDTAMASSRLPDDPHEATVVEGQAH